MPVSRVIKNPYVDRTSVPPMDTSAKSFHASLPGFVPTPLRPADEAAKALGVAGVHVKDESQRVGMPAFKILGASWATYRVIMQHLGLDVSAEPTIEELKALVAEKASDLTVVTATDGNHGRATARMAKMLGLPCIVHVPHDMVESRIKAIQRNNAEVIVNDGNYDDAVAAAAAMMDDKHVVISDTSWEGYTECPQWVIDGYSTMLGEVIDLIEKGRIPEPTVVVAQMGVGAFSAAVARAFANRPARLLIGAEPTEAECLMASIDAGGEVTTIDTGFTTMAGLSCGTPSPIAWPVNKAAYDLFVSTDDAHTEEATRLLYQDYINAGESGAAGLAALLQQKDAIGLKADDEVLIFLTEGVTDPVNFARVVGEPAAL